jgi:hypothetical protein
MFCGMQNNSIAAVRKFPLVFTLMMITNEKLELGHKHTGVLISP